MNPAPEGAGDEPGTSAERLRARVQHGDRPAVLWELQPHPGVERVTLTAPGLDSAWSSDELRGEALLSPVPGASELRSFG